MKKSHIFLSATLIAINIHATAQTIANVAVSGKVGIGTSTIPTDAKLHIYNTQYFLSTTNVPEILIDRTTLGTVTNFLQINERSVFSPASATVLDVINPVGWYGILQPKPTQPLDVKGNGRIESNLMVEGGLIDMSEPLSDAWRSLQANSNVQGLSLSSKTNSSNGSCIEMYSAGHFGDPGSIHYTSNGNIGNGHLFLNYTGGGWHTNLTIQNNGHTFIGHDINLSSANPDNILTVQDQLGFISNGDGDWRHIDGNSNTGVLTMASKTNSYDGSCIEMYGAGHSTGLGCIHYISNANASSTGFGHLFLSLAGTSFSSLMAICNNGKVIIGKDLIFSASAPDGYLLYVETGILTEKLKVANHSDGANWADFVFNNNYKLMPLNEVEGYVSLNKHLPEIPSASDVAKDGIDVASMDAKLLQKIEELTLYVIQQQKEINELKKQINH